MQPLARAPNAAGPAARSGALLALVLSSASCAAPPARSTVTLTIRAVDDHGAPVAGARIWGRSEALGTSPADGRIVAELVAEPGDVIELRASCPAGYEDPARPRRIALPEGAAGSADIAADLVCRSLTRAVVIAVRTGMPDLAGMPIEVDGEPRGQCGADGAAHLLLHRRPGTQIRLVLDNAGTPELRPRRPVHVIAVPPEDSVAVIEQRFERPRRARRARPARPAGPARASTRPRPFRIR